MNTSTKSERTQMRKPTLICLVSVNAWRLVASFLIVTAPTVAQDLNGNFQQDSLELRNGAPDCNLNGTIDSVDTSKPYLSHPISLLNGVDQFQNNVWGIVPLDFDQDGRMDLALCAFTSTNLGHIALWHNEGGPALVFHSEIAFPDARPTVITAADIDGDLKTDLIAGDSSFNRVYVLRATGAGTFAPPVTLAGDTSTNGSVGIAAGDLDNDGDIDIAATSWGTNKVNVFRNNGNGSFGSSIPYPTQYQPRDVAIGDFTGDGLADLAIANEFYSSVPASANGTVTLLRNTGNAVFVTHANLPMPIGNAPFNYQARPQMVELCDIDHDGDNDLITSSKLSNTLAIHLNNGLGAFTLGQRFGGINIEANARDIRIADLDGDGWEEIVWGDPDQCIAGVYKNSAGTLTLRQNLATATGGSLYLGIADFSGDGLPDIVSANDAGRTFSILENKGQLTFNTPIHLRPDEYPQPAFFADFNNDGVTDMGALRSDYLQTTWNIAVYLGLGNAVFNKTAISTSVTGSSTIVPFDVNHDGDIDLIGTGGHCYVYLGNGNGTFQPAVNSNLAIVALRCVLADLNMDTHLDIAWMVGGHPGSFQVSLGDGVSRFLAPTSYVMLAENESVGVGDINGDGAPELFAGFRQQLAPPAGGVLSMLPNNGNGTFGTRQDRFIVGTPLNPAVAAIAVSDFDGDNDGDVIVSANGLRLYRNPGDGVLPSTPVIVNQNSVSELSATDIDLDGDIDLYGRGLTGVVFLNSGSAAFGPPMFMHPYDSNARGFLVTDVNDDGRKDLVIRPENSWGTFLFLNLAQRSLDVNVNGVPDECETPRCVADFNADGIVDFFDYLDFVSQFSNNALAADVNHDGIVDFFDYLDFVAAFATGC